MKNQAIGNLILKITIVLLAVSAIVITIFLCIKASSDDRVIRKEITVEAGTADFTAKHFLRDETLSARFSADSSYNLNKVGSYNLQLIIGEDRYNVILHVVDTVAPVAESKPMLVEKGIILTPEQLLVGPIQDATAVRAEYAKGKEPDTSKTGEQDVSILLTDEGGQSLLIKTKIYVTETVDRVPYELGSPYPELSEFIGVNPDASFNPPLSELSIKKPGTYYLDVDIFGSTYSVIMDAVDTVLPVAEPVKGMEIYPGSPLPAPQDLVTNVYDATELTFAYAGKYNSFTEPGNYQVVVAITDLGGNVTQVVVELRVLDKSNKDTDPPVITGAVDLTANIGNTINYAENITVYDARDGKLDIYDPARFRIDTSAVRAHVVGTYPVTYTATDRSGNEASVTVQISIRHMEVTDAEVYAYAGTVVKNQLKISDSMSKAQKIQAIYEYVYDLTADFSTDVSSDINDRYTRTGYYGLLGFAGDSYAASGMLQVLFDVAGIEYKVVNRVSSDFLHRWLLVDFGDGWFHVDAMQNGYVWTNDNRILKSDSKEAEELEISNIRLTYKMTDADLASYTKLMNMHRVGWNYYSFNSSAFPHTPVRNADGSYQPVYYTITYVAGFGGTITGVVTQTVAHGESSSTVVALPNYLYKFVRWDDGVTTAERSDAVNSDRTFKAIFDFNPDAAVFYTLKYQAGVGGYVTGHIEQQLREGSEGLAVTAVASAGYRFVRWSDGKTEATRTDIATASMTVTAIFEALPVYTATYMPMPGGRLSGSATQKVPEGSETTAVTAIPSEGYRFIGWDDGKTEATRTDILYGNITVAAKFERIPEEEQKTVVYVDAGHGFANSEGIIDKGAGENTAYTALTGKFESDLNLAVAMKVKEILLSRGYAVIMTRESESTENVTVTDRVERVNASNADIFVSIHANSFNSESVKGARVHYSSENANADVCYGYATTMAAAINATSGASLKNVTVQDHPNIAVIRGILVPTVLVETCFLTSPEDATLANTDAWITAMAKGICLGIENQLKK